MDKRDIYKQLAAQVTQGELAFPTSAQVALKLRKMLDDPECHVDAAAKLVQAEPLLAARVVAIANSVAFNRAGREITDVRTAVSRLGFRTLRSLAMAVVTRQMAGKSADPTTQKLANQLWEHTAHVASLAHVIARRITHLDPETAMFAGIVHEVGGFFLLSCAPKHPGLLEGDADVWVAEGDAEVGRAVLKVLAVPESVAGAVEDFWDGFLAMPPSSLSDTLLLAEALAPVPSPLREESDRSAGAGMAASLEMVVGEELLTDILAESAEEVRSLTAALQF